MDFKAVISILWNHFEQEHVEYAVIGGFAIGALGILRSTMDIDLLVNKNDLHRVDRILTSQLYRLHYRSENVSQYVSDLKLLGTIDLLHAFRPHAYAMLKRAKKIAIFDGQFAIPVLLPEDLIGLKLQALRNDPRRETQEYADIELLLEHCSQQIDWTLVREYFDVFNLQEDFKRLSTKYGTLK